MDRCSAGVTRIALLARLRRKTMSGAVTVHVERTDNGFWTYLRRSAGELPGTPLHDILKWVLEQLNFGHFEKQRDSRGDVVSMTIGRQQHWELPRMMRPLRTPGGVCSL